MAWPAHDDPEPPLWCIIMSDGPGERQGLGGYWGIPMERWVWAHDGKQPTAVLMITMIKKPSRPRGITLRDGMGDVDPTTY